MVNTSELAINLVNPNMPTMLIGMNQKDVSGLWFVFYQSEDNNLPGDS